MYAKHRRLREIVAANDSAVVAFSGGVDSSVLAKTAREELGERAVAVTLDAPVFPRSELKNAKKTASKIGIKHEVIKFGLLDKKEFAANNKDRCYYCKRFFSKILTEYAKKNNYSAVFDGTNADDLKEDRPGLQAIKEAGVSSPLAEAKLGKDEVRKLAKKLGLNNYDRPSNTCLATRIQCSEPITKEKLALVEAAEEYIRSLGINDLRVRISGQEARVEVSEKDMPIIEKNKTNIGEKMRVFGFRETSFAARS